MKRSAAARVDVDVVGAQLGRSNYEGSLLLACLFAGAVPEKDCLLEHQSVPLWDIDRGEGEEYRNRAREGKRERERYIYIHIDIDRYIDR